RRSTAPENARHAAIEYARFDRAYARVCKRDAETWSRTYPSDRQPPRIPGDTWLRRLCSEQGLRAPLWGGAACRTEALRHRGDGFVSWSMCDFLQCGGLAKRDVGCPHADDGAWPSSAGRDSRNAGSKI